MQATFKGSLKPLRAVPAARRAVATRAVCSAEAPKVGTALAAAALAAALSLGSVQAAHADIAGLTPCSESKGFAKRQKKEITSLQKRLKQVRRAELARARHAPCTLHGCPRANAARCRAVRPHERTRAGADGDHRAYGEALCQL